MEKYTPEDLIRKYLAGHCTAEEKALVESWHLKDLSESASLPSREQIDIVHQRTQFALAQHIQASRRRPITRQWWFRAAAAALLAGIISTLAYLYYIQPSGVAGPSALQAQQTILPGRDGAVLTLADGRTMVLDSLGNGLLTTQNGTKVLLNNGQLTYQADTTRATAVTWNTISTTRGRQFKVILPDGSEVWLNATSSLRYPTAFIGDERKVYVTGEAYFEVKSLLLPGASRKMPFKVSIANASGSPLGEVEVLGTHFNINAYEDEDAVRTTLLEGKVKLTADSYQDESKTQADNLQISAILNPGQQAALPLLLKSQQSSQIPVRTVNVDQVIAWKNGVFNFEDASLEKVMRQLARWYDIDVVYEKGIPDIMFEGEMNRQNNLTDVLRSLEKLGVHFKIEGRHLIVLP